jgi:hypothetical protein
MSGNVTLIIHNNESIRGRKVEVFINGVYKFYIFSQKKKESEILAEVNTQIKINKQLGGGFSPN